MAKLLTLREMEIFKVALDLAIQLDMCNPDFGFLPSLETTANNVAKRLSFEIDPDDIAEICEEAGQ